jgi:RimJ/RimL family protein N-acetyltransferase
MSKPEIIVTSRLILRPFAKEIINKNYVDWLNDEEITSYLEINGSYNLEMLSTYVDSMIKNNVFIWAIYIKNRDSHIGNIKIDPINFKHGLGEYGILMGNKKEWGKGYAYEASLAVIEYCFSNLGIRKITLGVIRDNISAYKLYQKLGFQREGIYKFHGYYNDKLCDCIRMALFNPSFKYL